MGKEDGRATALPEIVKDSDTAAYLARGAFSYFAGSMRSRARVSALRASTQCIDAPGAAADEEECEEEDAVDCL